MINLTETPLDGHTPDLTITLISLEDYEALQETAYLLRAPKNARRLLESVAELEQGGGQEKELLE